MLQVACAGPRKDSPNTQTYLRRGHSRANAAVEKFERSERNFTHRETYAPRLMIQTAVSTGIAQCWTHKREKWSTGLRNRGVFLCKDNNKKSPVVWEYVEAGFCHKWPSIPDDKQCEINRGYVVKPPRAAAQQCNNKQSAECTFSGGSVLLLYVQQVLLALLLHGRTVYYFPIQCGRRSD